LVGHRKAGASESEITEWVKREPMRKSDYAGMYLLRAGVTDRTPGEDLPAAIAGVERPVWQLPDYHGYVVRESINRSTPQILNVDRESILPIGVFETAKKTPVKSDLVSFAEAYRMMRTGDFARAKRLLEEALALYDPRLTDVGYLLPYYAFAAAKSSDGQSVLARLEKFEPRQQRFDYYLSRAVVAGLGGKTSDSLRDLKLALHRRPFTQARPVYSEYQFAEICEWLYETTKNPKYRDVALSWAKSVQGFSPWFAWPYALEAKLAPKGADRAIAMAFYLDPNSERLAKVPKSEIDAAVKDIAGRNPFLKTQRAPKESST
jgi:predicted component of type VI protein secretion system